MYFCVGPQENRALCIVVGVLVTSSFSSQSPAQCVSSRESRRMSPHTHDALPLGTASTGCVDPRSAVILLSERSAEAGNYTCLALAHTDAHIHTHINRTQTQYKSAKSVISDFLWRCNITAARHGSLPPWIISPGTAERAFMGKTLHVSTCCKTMATLWQHRDTIHV